MATRFFQEPLNTLSTALQDRAAKDKNKALTRCALLTAVHFLMQIRDTMGAYMSEGARDAADCMRRLGVA